MKVAQATHINIQCGYAQAFFKEVPGIASLATGDIEHTAAGRDQTCEPHDPRRWMVDVLRRFHNLVINNSGSIFGTVRTASGARLRENRQCR